MRSMILANLEGKLDQIKNKGCIRYLSPNECTYIKDGRSVAHIGVMKYHKSLNL